MIYIIISVLMTDKCPKKLIRPVAAVGLSIYQNAEVTLNRSSDEISPKSILSMVPISSPCNYPKLPATRALDETTGIGSSQTDYQDLIQRNHHLTELGDIRIFISSASINTKGLFTTDGKSSLSNFIVMIICTGVASYLFSIPYQNTEF